MTAAVDARKPAAQSAPQAFLVGRARWRWPETVFWLAAPASYLLFGGAFGLPNLHQLISEIAVVALFVLSLDLILGFAGIVSLGHGAFFGIGVYAAGLAAKWGAGSFPASDPILGLLFAGLIAGAVGLATSFLVLRGSDLTRLMVTLGVALIVEEICNQARWLTGGSDGLQGVTPAPVLGLFDFDLAGDVAAVYSLLVLFVLFLLARRLVNSPFGLSLRAIKGNTLRARSVGAPVEARLVAAYTIGAAMAGVAGGLLAQTTQSASLDMAAFHRSGDALVILVFGGAGRLYGGLIGAATFTVLSDWLSGITPEYWLFWLGLVIVVLVLFVQGGLLGLADGLRARLWRKDARAKDAP
jgi:branched-chain amino acid transport system permease protein